MSTDTEFTFIAEAVLLPDVAIGEAAGERVGGVRLGANATSTVSGIRFGAAAGTVVEIRVLSSPDDRDPAGIVGPAGSSSQDGGLSPQLVFDAEHGWLAYVFEAHLKARIGKTLEQVGFAVDGQKAVTLLDYRRHPLNRNLAAAIAEDIARPRLAARKSDLLRLRPGDALAYGLRGELGMRLELKVADLISGSVGQLGRWIHTDKPLGLRIASGLTVSASVRWTDDFLVVFSGLEDGRIRLAVQKAQIRSQGVSATLGVTAELEASESFEAALREILNRLMGESVNVIDELFEVSGIRELSEDPNRWALFLVVASRLGFAGGPLIQQTHSLVEIYEAWTALKKRVDKGIRRWIEAKITSSFTYDYRRIRESESVLQAVVEPQTLEDWHHDLLRARLDSPLLALRERPELVERFLHREQVECFSTWGFSLSLGRDWGLETRSSKHFRRVVRTDLQGRRQVSFVGDRGYEGKLGGNAVSWKVDFKAEMADFSVHGPPHGPAAAELELGLAISWRQQERRASLKELEALLDHGRLWGFLDRDDLDDLSTELWEAVGKSKQRKGFVAELGLVLDHSAWLEGARSVLQGGDPLLANALGGALPYWKDLEARRSAAERSRLYTPLWQQFLALDRVQRRNLSRRELGEKARAVLRRMDGGKKAASREAVLAERSDLTFAAQARNHPTLKEDVADFRSALARLDEIYSLGIETPDLSSAGLLVRAFSVEELPKIFNDLQKFWDQALYVRALGALLAQTLAIERLGAYFWIEIQGESERRVYLGSKQTA